MSSEKLKEYLLRIADNVQESTKLDDIYDQLALLADIEESEEQEKRGEVLTRAEVVSKSKEWLK